MKGTWRRYAVSGHRAASPSRTRKCMRSNRHSRRLRRYGRHEQDEMMLFWRTCGHMDCWVDVKWPRLLLVDYGQRRVEDAPNCV